MSACLICQKTPEYASVKFLEFRAQISVFGRLYSSICPKLWSKFDPGEMWCDVMWCDIVIRSIVFQSQSAWRPTCQIFRQAALGLVGSSRLRAGESINPSNQNKHGQLNLVKFEQTCLLKKWWFRFEEKKSLEQKSYNIVRQAQSYI